MVLSPFGLYVHWPFCQSKCPYCDFNSHVAARIDQERWRAAYLLEIKRCFQEIGLRPVSSIFFGGGTPSLMPPQTCDAILNTIDQTFGLQDNCEITLEANPTTVERDTFPALKSAGINRLSIGVQSFDDRALAFLGRAHKAEEARAALSYAEKTFERFSFDLIYARPRQTLKEWETELKTALEYGTHHLSLYQLTIEPGTEFFKNQIEGADEDLGADLFDLTQDIMENAGLPAYEISNHAAPGEESRHNLIYWQGDTYLGIGPGAHSRLHLNNQFYAAHQIYKPDLWLDAVHTKKGGEQKRKIINDRQRAEEILMMGLRLTDGISKDTFQAHTGLNLKDILDPSGLETLLEHDLIKETPTHFKATQQGRACLNEVLKILL